MSVSAICRASRALSQKIILTARRSISSQTIAASVRTLASQAHDAKAHSQDPAKANYEARCDLAACYRILYNLGFSEGTCNHLSLSCPAKDGSGKVMLIIPYGLYWTEVTASSLIGVSLKEPKNPVVVEEGCGQPDISAMCIHNGIHQTRAESGITCVLHSHVPYATALTCIKDQKLEMTHQNSTRFYGEICYDNGYDGVATSLDEGFRLGKVLKDKTVMMMGNHGVLVLGRTVSEAVDHMYYLERAAQVQVLAMSTGKDLSLIPDKLVEQNKQFLKENARHYADNHFNALKRTIENETPCYRD
ncbi:putative aldolase class 2 protein PA3430 [Rhopilema esculentum]|uniref:putative aldolase class 2 protein PA3430 n=1 Tax=Rhopilema esculentum TaxID=499914 RepID=UPI0031DD6CED|eukprot:gene7797-13653_t